ncbi:uncharacterized protein LOC122644893 [Telopea speciosissima]|uniref:uncharacterized protein LOC122644893 n=1 Tax=Telopea speciosissima TaxID=54955 RepID=UPI001CC39BF6|nr:uncharacterized protein LOC122644893 [Telopea speciosissima]
MAPLRRSQSSHQPQDEDEIHLPEVPNWQQEDLPAPPVQGATINRDEMIGIFTAAFVGAIQQAQAVPVNNPPRPIDGTSKMVTEFRKLRPLAFKGTSADPIIAKGWLRELEKNFELLQCSDEQKVACSTYILQGEADLWWQTTKRILEGQLVTWAQFLELFREKYFPITVRQAKAAEFIKLQQGSMTVIDYEKKFEELSHYTPHLVATDVDKARLFESGLNNGIQRMVTALELNTYVEVVRRALLYEGPVKGTQKVFFKANGKESGISQHRAAGVILHRSSK